jgi:hypothetical protein
MTTQKSKSNRAPWILVGVLGCFVLCLLAALGGIGAYWVYGSVRTTPVVQGRQTPLSPLTVGSSKRYDHAEFTFDYPPGYQTFADFYPTAFGFPYTPGRDKELDADELGGVLMPFTSLTPGINDKYLTSDKIYRKALPSGSSLNAVYTQAYTGTYSGNYAKSNPVSDRTIMVDGVTAVEKVYQKPSGGAWYQIREVWFEKNSKIYMIACRTIPSWYDEHLPEFNLIVDSFHVK